MSDPTMDARLLADWFALDAPRKAPRSLRDEIVAATAAVSPRPAWRARWAHRRERSSASRRILLSLALLGLLVALAAGALYFGSTPVRERPPASVPGASVCTSGEPAPIDPAGVLEIPDTHLRLTHEPAASLALEARQRPGAIAFGDGVESRDYGYLSAGVPGGAQGIVVAGSARGIVVAEVTEATVHTGMGDKPPLGSDPASFLEGLRNQAGFAVTNVATADLSGRTGWAADISSEAVRIPLTGWSHIDRPGAPLGRYCIVDFSLLSRVIVADIDGSIVLVQIWAATEDDLGDWLPIAQGFVKSIRFEVGS